MSCFSGHPRSKKWTLDFAPPFSPRFYFPLSPRSYFHTRQRFPLLNHVTSGCMSPRSIFQTSQRFLLPNHVTSGSHEPAILFSIWSAVSPTGNDMTSSSGHVIALDQSGASIFSQRAQCTTNLFQALPLNTHLFVHQKFLKSSTEGSLPNF